MFRYEHDTYGTVVGAASLPELRRYITSTGSHFWSTETMRWFGTRNVHHFGGIAVVGLDSKAPEGIDPYWVRIFTDVTRDNGDVFANSELIGRYPTRKTADAAARDIANTIATEGK